MRFAPWILVGLLGLGSTGCFYHHHRPRISPAACLLPFLCMSATSHARHAEVHNHHRGCGCPSRIYQGRRVYWYNGQWEYHRHGRAYSVPDCPPPY